MRMEIFLEMFIKKKTNTYSVLPHFKLELKQNYTKSNQSFSFILSKISEQFHRGFYSRNKIIN